MFSFTVGANGVGVDGGLVVTGGICCNGVQTPPPQSQFSGSLDPLNYTAEEIGYAVYELLRCLRDHGFMVDA